MSVNLDLGQPPTWVVLPPNASDPPEWKIINTNFQTVTIRDITSFTYESSNRQIEWAFKPTAVAPGDTTWSVIRWTEIAN